MQSAQSELSTRHIPHARSACAAAAAPLLLGAVLTGSLLTGCTQAGNSPSSPLPQDTSPAVSQTNRTGDAQDTRIVVYLWENTLFKDFEEYVEEQCPGVDVEFVAGNNNVFLYDYLEKNGELPDIITTRRFSAADAKALTPYLLDFGSQDIVSTFYSYTLQYYTSPNGEIQWLPVCGIPETLILNKSLLDRYGIAVPENYEEFAAMCAELKRHGISPYAHDLSMDYSAHSLLQGSAIDQFASIEGIEWRAQAEAASGEAASGEVAFDEELWGAIFDELQIFIEDTGLTADYLAMGYSDVMNEFISGKAALRNGTPSVFATLQEAMDDELVHLPYFAQTGDGSWIYTYPSLNIAMNRRLQDDPQKLAAANQVLACFLSPEGQKIIAAGSGLISYNTNVSSDLTGMTGVEHEVAHNALYIRYASNNSFSASLEAVTGLIDGSMNKEQALEAFKEAFNAPAATGDPVIEFEKTYRLALNESGGRDAASSVLTTVRKKIGADLAFTPYYIYASSIYEGPTTLSELGVIPNNNQGAPLYQATLTGAEVKELVGAYFEDTGWAFDVSTAYELPVASGMKLVLAETDDGYTLNDILVGGSSIDDTASYTLITTLQMSPLFERVFPDKALQNLGTNVQMNWKTVVGDGVQPAAPEDYIAIER